MIPFLAVVVASLVGAGIIWRLRQTGARRGAPGRGHSAQPRQSFTLSPTQQALKALVPKDPDANSPDSTAASAMGRPSRRSDRVLIRIPLEVTGKDVAGNSFTERAHTMVINRNGASFVLRDSLVPEEQITVKNLQSGQSCRFRARAGAKDLPGGLREWGIECLDPAPNFWGISFPELQEQTSVDEETSGCLLECTVCHYREMTRVALKEYRTTVEKTSLTRNCIWCGRQTEWKFALIEGDVEATSSPSLQDWEVAASLSSGMELRREERRIVQLPISIRDREGREESTITENVSRSGVCCAANMELNIGDRVFVKLASNEWSGEVEFRAQIIWCRESDEKRGNLYGLKLGPAAAASGFLKNVG
ncbi:MAG TPA: PilZ domain-containing protein [Terriglobia bacterium]|nr:PilZ domain-containing protein [Terriglobia bacterium]